MRQETAEKLWDHRLVCDSHEFTKTTVQRDEATGARYYGYRCMKCKGEIKEFIPMTAAEELPKEKAA